MKRTYSTCFPVLLLILLCVISSEVLANKTAVRIEVPESAEKGTEITIKVHVSHDGNNFLHYTNWVSIKINGQEVKRWKFSMFKRPESDNITLKIKYLITESITIVAEANCNRHGSDGAKTAIVSVK